LSRNCRRRLRKCDALVREYVEKFAQQLEEKEDARLQEYQQSFEEWLKRGQRESYYKN